jgi:hypothetical protein
MHELKTSLIRPASPFAVEPLAVDLVVVINLKDILNITYYKDSRSIRRISSPSVVVVGY